MLRRQRNLLELVIGTIVGNYGFVNSEDNTKKMKDGLALVFAISEINRMEEAGKEEKKKEKLSNHTEKDPTAAIKLEENGRIFGFLTVAEIEALL